MSLRPGIKGIMHTFFIAAVVWKRWLFLRVKNHIHIVVKIVAMRNFSTDTTASKVII
jgi:hypothetical protein